MGTSIALMIDQRVSEGIPSNFFNKKALTTTIPAQFVKKFNAKIVPVYIERLKDDKFKIYKDLFFIGDNHFNDKGNKVVAKEIIRKSKYFQKIIN